MSIVLPSLIGANKPASGGAFVNQYSVSFDGTDDYMDAGNVTELNSISAFTISMWINFEHITGSSIMSVFTSGSSTSDRIEIVFNSLSEVRFGVNGSISSCSFNISSPTNYRSTDAWHNIVCTYDGTNVTLFFDGSQKATTTSSVPSSTSSTHGNDATVGRRTLGGGSFYFNGYIDEVAIFNSALTAEQITNIYKGEENGGSGGTHGVPGSLSTFNPVAWWRMGDGSDGSGNADGTLVNIGGTDFPQIYNVATDGSDNRITGIDGSLTNIASPNGIVTNVP